MGFGPFRDLHEASIYTNHPIDTLREYHHRRNDALYRTTASIEGFDGGAVIVHVTSPEFLESPTADQINPAELQEDHRKLPVLKNGTGSETGSEIDHRGVLATTADRRENRRARTRIGRSGILESVSTKILADKWAGDTDKSVLVTGKFEQGLVNIVQTYIDRIRDGVQTETLATVSYLNLDDVIITSSNDFNRDREMKGTPVRTPVVSLGDENLRDELTPLIRPIWNAIGRKKSEHMIDGEWEFDS